MTGQPLIAVRSVSKRYGEVVALRGVSLDAAEGEVKCLLGDNGAGKSTLIKILAGVVRPDSGEIEIEGERTLLTSPKDSLDRGIATVFQDLAVVSIMPVHRNFFLGREPTRGWGCFARLDKALATTVTRDALADVGIRLKDVTRPIATLSGGERQCVAIARAIHFGARALVLDEPTSALGVKEAEVVLRFVVEARSKGIAIVFITHNVHHALAVGDSFTILDHGEVVGTFDRDQVEPSELVRLMAGGRGVERLEREVGYARKVAIRRDGPDVTSPAS